MGLICIPYPKRQRLSLIVLFSYLVVSFLPSLGHCQKPATSPRIALLPPVIVAFADRSGRPEPNDAWSAAAVQTVSAAFLAEMAEKHAATMTVVAGVEGAVDRSFLEGLPNRLASLEGPVPEALLPLPYPAHVLTRMMEEHQLEAAWTITGIQVILPQNVDLQKVETRVLLRTALVDPRGEVLFSDIYDRTGASAVSLHDELPLTDDDLRDGKAARRIVRALLAEYRTDLQKAEAARVRGQEIEAHAVAEHVPVPAELRVGIGVFILADEGGDWAISFRPAESHWQFGYHYVRWRDDFDDPFTGRLLTRTTYSLQGLQVNYMFHPEKNGTWYLGASFLEYSATEVYLEAGASDSDSTTTLFLGGGYTGHLGQHVFYNIGISLAPWADIKTDTGYSSEESSGLFDVQLQLGAAF